MTQHGKQGEALAHGWAPQKVQCTACSPGLAAGLALQAYMSRAQRAVHWAIPVSMSPFTSVFAPLSLLKQDRKFVGNYKSVMTKIWVKPCSFQVSGLKGCCARSKFLKADMCSTDSKNWFRASSTGRQWLTGAIDVQKKGVRKRDCSSNRSISLRIPANAQIVNVTSFQIMAMDWDARDCWLAFSRLLCTTELGFLEHHLF